MNIDQLMKIIETNGGTLFFAFLGAIILFGKSVKEHMDRDEKDKMSNRIYWITFLGWMLGYPFAGIAVAVAYMASGNQFGAWLALQIGLTSPAIVLSIINSSANNMAKNPIQTEPEQ